MPIKLHLQKLSGRAQLRVHSLLNNHFLRLLLESNPSSNSIPHHLLLNNLIHKQQQKIKDLIIDMDNEYNKVFPSFTSFNKEFISGH